MLKSLVTGGAGFIGSHIADKLIENKHEVVIVDNFSTGKKSNVNHKAKLYEIDIQDSRLAKIFQQEKPDFVFHLAAQISVKKSVEDPTFDTRVNVLGSLNVLENCAKYKVKKVIFSSTGGAIYGNAKIIPTPETYKENPLSPYGINKLSVEKSLFYYKKVKNLDYVALKLSNVYGPRQNGDGEAGVIAIFINKILEGGQPVVYGLGQQTRDYVFIKDVVDAFIKAQKSGYSGIFNMGTGAETSVNDVFNMIVSRLKVKVSKKYEPQRKGEQARSCLDYSKANKKLGWFPKYGLNQGITETAEWFLSH